MLKGIYTLLITLNTSTTISVGKLGKISFPEGHYAYVGSALKGLHSRIARHLKKEKVLHWHIDYFLKEGVVREVIYGIDGQGKECAVALHLSGLLMLIPRFGCSDCRCKSHLYYWKDFCQVRKFVRSSFKEYGLVPRGWG